MKYLHHLFAGMLFVASSHGTAASIKELLEEAIDAPNGFVNAPLDGEITDLVRRTAPVQGDVMAHITTLKRFKEPDCRRFRIELKARFAPESGQSGFVPFPQMEMNYCRGGTHPEEGVDPEAPQRFMNQADEYARARGLAVPARPTPPGYTPAWVPANAPAVVAPAVSQQTTGSASPAVAVPPQQPSVAQPAATPAKTPATKKTGGKSSSTMPSGKKTSP